MLTGRYYEFSCRLLLLGEADTADTALRYTASQSLTWLGRCPKINVDLSYAHKRYLLQPVRLSECNVSRQPHETRASGTKKKQ